MERKMRLTGILIAWLLISFNAFAVIDTFEFDSQEQRARFAMLSEELRCPKCQNQNLAGSNSGIALDLRTELHRMVISGQSTEQIKAFMVERYGEFVLYKPSVNSLTYVLWYGPFVLLGLGFILVIVMIKQRSSNRAQQRTQTPAKNTVDSEHQQRIKDLLDKNK